MIKERLELLKGISNDIIYKNYSLFMILRPRQLREIIFYILYIRDFSGSVDPETIFFLMKRFKVSKKCIKNILDECQAFFLKLNEIDEIISKFSTEYKINRIPSVEKNVLRLGVYELFFEGKTPGKVVIAEGIRISKKFAGKEAALFVNAILDKVYKGLLQSAQSAD